jgi:hypothetical protein
MLIVSKMRRRVSATVFSIARASAKSNTLVNSSNRVNRKSQDP